MPHNAALFPRFSQDTRDRPIYVPCPGWLCRFQEAPASKRSFAFSPPRALSHVVDPDAHSTALVPFRLSRAVRKATDAAREVVRTANFLAFLGLAKCFLYVKSGLRGCPICPEHRSRSAIGSRCGQRVGPRHARPPGGEAAHDQDL